MYKNRLICSLLVAFSVSGAMIGCDAAKQGTKPPVKTGPGSSTGGGTVVPPAPTSGAKETPKTDAKPADTDTAPKADDAAKTDEPPKTDAPKAEEKN